MLDRVGVMEIDACMSPHGCAYYICAHAEIVQEHTLICADDQSTMWLSLSLMAITHTTYTRQKIAE